MSPEPELVNHLRKDLHDLCQPLAVLQCWLELSQMSEDHRQMTAAVAGGLTEMERIRIHIAKMRRRLSDAETRES